MDSSVRLLDRKQNREESRQVDFESVDIDLIQNKTKIMFSIQISPPWLCGNKLYANQAALMEEKCVDF